MSLYVVSVATLMGCLCLLLLVQQVRVHRYRQACASLGVQNERLARDLKLETAENEGLLDDVSWVALIFEASGGSIQYANRAALTLFQVADAQALNFLWFDDDAVWSSEPHGRDSFRQWLLRASGQSDQIREWLLPVAGGGHAHLEASARRIRFQQESALLVTAKDISPFVEARTEMLNKQRVLNALVVDRPLADVLDQIAELAESKVAGSQCCVLVLNRQQRTLSCVGQGRFTADYRQLVGETPCQYGATSAGTAAYTNRQVVSQDLLADPSWHLHREGLQKLGVMAVWSLPFVDSTGAVCGVVNLFFNSPADLTEEHVEQLGPVLHLCSLAAERANQQARLARILSSETFIREVGASIHELSNEAYAEELKAILIKMCGYLDVPSMALWSSRQSDSGVLRLLCESQDFPAFTDDIPVADLQAVLGAAGKAYLQPGQSEHYQSLCLDNLEWPLFIMAISPDRSTLDGLLVVSLGTERLPVELESYLEIISDMLANALGKIWLMEALSEKAAKDRSEREKLEGELNIAKEIQAAMIPGGGQYGRINQGWDIRARLRPARAVGGDFFSDITLPDGRVLVAVGDVSDKGVPAALFMSKVVTILNFLTRELLDLSSIMARLNDELVVGNDNCMFATLIGVVLDTRTGQMEYCSAGHCAPLVVRQGISPAFLAEEHGPPVGLYEEAEFPSHRMSLPAESSLVLYSDGVTEALNAAGEVFGEDRLAELARLLVGQQGNLVESIDTMVRAYAGASPQSDDLTIMVVSKRQ
ncbi:MAG: GAF domain-containing SpoIIE family protein phosphatase [Marinobacter sp.]|uniref:GAF domain-containing SpoIIE family protein phosphatase n=1 Tax=Marinobacter sp. TaxID=50741 RepID=UPI00299F2F1E|nr:GAF domain-containing SpoIIE family protein phosphatase [Marinobacter sp.]MDX1756610.1 GAF domain-containing SpoIIE family protein phosphatase [Marinobacter sp.]